MQKVKAEPILDVEGLKTYFPIKRGILKRTVGWLKAVDDVSFFIRPGETLGLVGESGCGKTTCARSIIRLVEPTDGEIIFKGKNVREIPESEMRELRRDMQIIFQDPYASLNPRMSVTSIVGEGLRIHEMQPWSEIRARVGDLLEEVGLSRTFVNRYPHEFSGGQRQRIGIARALALNPEFIICDEAVSALDVSIQAQIINLLEDLQSQRGFAYLFIAHDLSVVEHISDRVAVMYLGKIVETATSEDLYRDPRHPYTIALLNAVPVPDPTRKKEVKRLRGQVPTLASLPKGCRFHPRCERKTGQCEQEEPPAVDLGNGHVVYCHECKK
ncbi:MAG: ATP-binding cassette domain-containing protein [Planctomycetota bacterium]|nr:MAG: ATP-binding cassette domain-containing protein [Planctomycetota bacterium]